MAERVLIDLTECHMKGEVYAVRGGKSKLVSLDSMETQVVADGTEAGLGLTQTMRLVNEHRRECGFEDVRQLQNIQKALPRGDVNFDCWFEGFLSKFKAKASCALI